MAILSPEEQELKILENKRKKKESDKNYYERNKDSIKEKQRDYVSKNYEKKIKYSKKKL